MLHDLELVDRLGAFAPFTFDGEVYRAARQNLSPLTPSLSGGRWVPVGGPSVLYTSLEKHGALAELAFHWGQFNPLPSRPAAVHRIALSTRKTLRLLQTDLETLGVKWNRYAEINYEQTQRIGAAVAFLECDGLVAPSARWDCDNLMIFTDHHGMSSDDLRVVSTEEVDWLAWAREHGFAV